MEKKELSQRIRKFLKEYAVVIDGEYTSPDAYQLEAAAVILESGKPLTTFPWSEWGSGGYKPYSSKKGSKEHDEILELIKCFQVIG